MNTKEFRYFLRHFKLNKHSALAPVPQHLLIGKVKIPVFINEFWTAKQRQSSSIHEISYRACFKAELPDFFIQIFTKQFDTVYDPFNGRGTTVVQAALMGRHIIANDVNPLSLLLTKPRIIIPAYQAIKSRLESIDLTTRLKPDIDLSMFYEKKTLANLLSMRQYLHTRSKKGLEDNVDAWLHMVATNRLTGHSPGFFSVYTLPPNQAVTAGRQVLINQKHRQKPEYRDIKKLIERKTLSLLQHIGPAGRHSDVNSLFLNCDAAKTSAIPGNSVALTVTSPPFLDIVKYAEDNWLRCWFNKIDIAQVEKKITMSKTLAEWSERMQQVFLELYRVTKPGGIVAFEVGEVRNGKIRMEEAVVPLGLKSGFSCDAILINQQVFTKTANIWGVNNNSAGTNSNRIVVFRKPD